MPLKQSAMGARRLKSRKKHPKWLKSLTKHPKWLTIFWLFFVIKESAGFQKAHEFLYFLTQYFDVRSSEFLCSYPMYEISQVGK